MTNDTAKIFHYESQRRGWILTIQHQQSGSSSTGGCDGLSIRELEQVWESENDRKPFYLSMEEQDEDTGNINVNFDSSKYDPIFQRLSQLLRKRTNNEEVFLWGRQISNRLVSLVAQFPHCKHLFLPKITNFKPLVRAIRKGELVGLESLWIGGYGTSGHVQEKQPSQELMSLADAIHNNGQQQEKGGGLPNLKHFQLQNRIIITQDNGGESESSDPCWDCLEALVCALTSSSGQPTRRGSQAGRPTSRRTGGPIKVEISRIFVLDKQQGGGRRPRVQAYPLGPEHQQQLDTPPPSYYRLLNQRLRKLNLGLYPILSQLIRSNPNLTFPDIQHQVDFDTTAMAPWVEALQVFQDDGDWQAHQALAFKPVLAASAGAGGSSAYDRNKTKRTVQRTLAEAVSILDSPTCSFSSGGDKVVLTKESLLARQQDRRRSGSMNNKSNNKNSDLVTMKNLIPPVVSSSASSSTPADNKNPQLRPLFTTPTTKTPPPTSSMSMGMSSAMGFVVDEDYSGSSSGGSEHERVMRQALEASQQQLDAARQNYEQAKEDVRFDEALLQKQESRMFSSAAKKRDRRPDRDAAWHALKNQLRSSQLEEQKALQELEISKAGHTKLLQMISRKTAFGGLGQEMNYGTPTTTTTTSSQSQQRPQEQRTRLIHSA